MAKNSIGKKLRSLLPKEPDQEEKLRARRELGMESLPEGESLMNTAIFSRVHIAAVLESRSLADGAKPAAQEPVDELLLDEIAAEPAPRSSARETEAGPPADLAEVAALERAMMSAKDRDELAGLALRIASFYSRAAALFVVNRGMVTGLRSAGEGVAAGIEAVMIPEQAQSVICRAIETRGVARGGPPFGDVDERVLRAMGRSETLEMLALPVPIGDRIVNVLYADNGTDTLPDTAVGALRVLALGLAEAYERLIYERGDGATGGSEGE